MEDCFKDLSCKSVKASFTRVMACDSFSSPCQSEKSNNFFESSSAPFTELTSGVFNSSDSSIDSSSLASVPSDAPRMSLRIFSLQLGSVVSTGGSCASTSTSTKDTSRSGEMRDKSSSISSNSSPHSSIADI